VKPIDEVTGDVIEVAMQLHRELGPGLLESVYEIVLGGRLEALGYSVARQVPVGIDFDGVHFDPAFRIDLLVDDRLIVEIKSVDSLTAAHGKQLLTYLRLTKQPVGLLINFAGATLKEGLRRVVNNYDPSAPSAPLRLGVNPLPLSRG
jgi:iron complex transport system substrate-binding protein